MKLQTTTKLCPVEKGIHDNVTTPRKILHNDLPTSRCQGIVPLFPQCSYTWATYSYEVNFCHWMQAAPSSIKHFQTGLSWRKCLLSKPSNHIFPATTLIPRTSCSFLPLAFLNVTKAFLLLNLHTMASCVSNFNLQSWRYSLEMIILLCSTPALELFKSSCLSSTQSSIFIFLQLG